MTLADLAKEKAAAESSDSDSDSDDDSSSGNSSSSSSSSDSEDEVVEVNPKGKEIKKPEDAKPLKAIGMGKKTSFT